MPDPGDDVVDELAAVALDLLPADAQQLARIEAVPGQEPVQVCCRRVAGLAPSTITTRRLARASTSAALSPAAPPPTITTSTFSVISTTSTDDDPVSARCWQT
jgi:hypothetical protein